MGTEEHSNGWCQITFMEVAAWQARVRVDWTHLLSGHLEWHCFEKLLEVTLFQIAVRGDENAGERAGKGMPS